MADSSKILDLAGDPERPTVRLPEGDFEMRTPEELTFAQFGRQVAIGRELMERAGDVAQDGVMEELQERVVEAAHIILVDLTDEAARNLTPGKFLKINNFFNELASDDQTPASEPGSSSAPAASDSTETPAAV